eukprot:s2777_g9.t1
MEGTRDLQRGLSSQNILLWSLRGSYSADVTSCDTPDGCGFQTDAGYGEAAMGWLENEEAKLRAQSWTLSTSMDDLVDEGVQLLQVRDWIRCEYFAGRPMLPLRLIQRCRTIRELAAHVTVMSDCFAKRRQRARVWYRSTFRNLLEPMFSTGLACSPESLNDFNWEHVPSDITRFQPFVAKGAAVSLRKPPNNLKV